MATYSSLKHSVVHIDLVIISLRHRCSRDLAVYQLIISERAKSVHGILAFILHINIAKSVLCSGINRFQTSKNIEHYEIGPGILKF